MLSWSFRVLVIQVVCYSCARNHGLCTELASALPWWSCQFFATQSSNHFRHTTSRKHRIAPRKYFLLIVWFCGVQSWCTLHCRRVKEIGQHWLPVAANLLCYFGAPAMTDAPIGRTGILFRVITTSPCLINRDDDLQEVWIVVCKVQHVLSNFHAELCQLLCQHSLDKNFANAHHDIITQSLPNFLESLWLSIIWLWVKLDAKSLLNGFNQSNERAQHAYTLGIKVGN